MLTNPARARHHLQVIAMHHAMASPALTAVAHAAGMEVHVWTTNTRQMVRHAITAAVDAMVTDNPTDALRIVEAAWERCKHLI